MNFVIGNRERKVKFLIVANPRSGSTWLATMLGQLPDAITDYEIMWKRSDPNLPVLRSISDENFSCSDFLTRMSDQPIVGSKLMMEPRVVSPEEFQQLESTLDRDIRNAEL